MTQLKLAITGMHCGACVRRVTAALENTQGVKIETVEIGSARLEYDPGQVDPSTIMASVAKIGFSASAE